jgi:hypothetical protein
MTRRVERLTSKYVTFYDTIIQNKKEDGVTRQLWGKIPLWQRGNKGDFTNIGKISPRPSFPKRGKYN